MTGGVQPSGHAGDGPAPSVAIFVAGQRGVQVRLALLKPQNKALHAFRPCRSLPAIQLRPRRVPLCSPSLSVACVLVSRDCVAVISLALSLGRMALTLVAMRRRVARAASGAARGASACGWRRLAACPASRLRRVPWPCAVCMLCCRTVRGTRCGMLVDFHVGCRAYQCRIGGKCCPFRF